MVQAKYKKSITHTKNPVYEKTFTGNSGPVSEYFISGELTGKERDPETGLYYYGARYLDPRTSRWISADPAMWEGDYIPSAPINDQARERNQNLPGIGGIFNYVNFHVYHYGGNNPVRLVDPDGRFSPGRVFDGILRATSGIGLMVTGCSMIGAAGAGAVGSFGLSTPASIAVGVVGFGVFVEGLVHFSFGISEAMTGAFGVDMPDTPISTGGLIGAAIDVSNGHNRPTQGAGSAERTGDNISRTVTTVAGVTSNAQNIANVANTSGAVRALVETAANANDARNNSRTTQSPTAQQTQMGANSNQVGPGGRSGPDAQQRNVYQNVHRGYSGPPGF